MWYKEYKDYPPDTDLKHERVASGHGIVGCEMHEQLGWGHSHKMNTPKPKKTFWSRLCIKLFKKRAKYE